VADKDDTYNHKRAWATLPRKTTNGMPYNYYPRGRVEVKLNKAVIYLNPNICTESVIADIKLEFGLTDIVVEVRIDGSKHYKCYLDDSISN
jgi:hypothetical protein